MNKNKNLFFCMPNTKILGQKIANELEIKLSQIHRIEYADGEICIHSKESVRNKDVYVVTSISKPVNDHLVELLIFIDSLKRACAKSINVVITYYGYARQDRKVSSRQPITAKLVADLLEVAGTTKVIAVDLHNPSIQGFFNIPVDDLRGQYVLAPTLKRVEKNFSIVSPDHGGTTRARKLAELISNTIQISIIDKRRIGPNQSVISGVLGDVRGKNCFIVDDMIDTGGTIINAAKALIERGAKKVYVGATHGVFSKGFDNFEKCSCVEKVFVTDSIESVYGIKSDKLEIISLNWFLAKAIEATSESNSIKEKVYSVIEKDLKNGLIRN